MEVTVTDFDPRFRGTDDRRNFAPDEVVVRLNASDTAKKHSLTGLSYSAALCYFRLRPYA